MRCFFSAVSNSDVDSTRKDLFSYLKENLTKIIMVAKTVTSMDRVPSRYIKCGQYLEELLENCTSDAEVFNETILESSLKEFFKLDSEALEQFQYYPAGEKWDISQKEIVFLYRTLLEAIRIVALFHDVGHPPYSHVIEDALNKLKNEIEESGNQFNEEKKTKFKSCMDSLRAFSCNNAIKYVTPGIFNSNSPCRFCNCDQERCRV